MSRGDQRERDRQKNQAKQAAKAKAQKVSGVCAFVKGVRVIVQGDSLRCVETTSRLALPARILGSHRRHLTYPALRRTFSGR
jgi:hypothetical protein